MEILRIRKTSVPGTEAGLGDTLGPWAECVNRVPSGHVLQQRRAELLLCTFHCKAHFRARVSGDTGSGSYLSCAGSPRAWLLCQGRRRRAHDCTLLGCALKKHSEKKKKKHSGWLYDSDLLTILYNLDILYILYFIENLFLIRRLPLCGQRWDLVKITFPQTVL